MKPFIRFHGFAVIFFLIATLSGKKHFVFILDKLFELDIK